MERYVYVCIYIYSIHRYMCTEISLLVDSLRPCPKTGYNIHFHQIASLYSITFPLITIPLNPHSMSLESIYYMYIYKYIYICII